MNDSSDKNSPNPRPSNGDRLIIPQSPSQSLRSEQGTPPPRRSRAARSQVVIFINFLLSAVVLGLIGLGLLFWFGADEFSKPGREHTAATFVVKKNASVSRISKQLFDRGLISDARIFSIGVRVYGKAHLLKAGEYEIKAKASMKDIMNTFVEGRAIEHSLTIPEGFTTYQAMQRIKDSDVLVGDMPDIFPPEGALIADTQKFQRGTTRADIIQRMMDQQKKMVNEIWERRDSDLPVKTINEFVTLASIVEKETGRTDERTRVAAVFINRLRKGMRLQSDPTIIYGIFGGEGKPSDRPIYRSDIDKPTPYNTYTIKGLPPTPIATPGRAALEAVAHPSKTKDLYFVADGTGGHVFASTLKEHNDNVRRWRAIEKSKQK